MKAFVILCTIMTLRAVMSISISSKIGSCLHRPISLRKTQKSTKQTNVIQNSAIKLKHVWASSFPHVKSAFISSVIVTATLTLLHQFFAVSDKVMWCIQFKVYKLNVKLISCTLVVVNSTKNSAWTTTSPLGHHFLFLTSSLLSNLDKSEINAIIAHEVGHMKNQDSNKSYRWLFGDCFLSNLCNSLYVRGLSVLMWGKRSRRSEFLADIHSANLLQSPYPLISALKKLDLLNGQCDKLSEDEKRRRDEIVHVYEKRPLFDDLKDCVGEILSIFHKLSNVDTHPSTEDRISNLEAYASKYMFWQVLSPPLMSTTNALELDSIKIDNDVLWQRILYWGYIFLVVNILFIFANTFVNFLKFLFSTDDFYI